jgi:hypothetical protein
MLPWMGLKENRPRSRYEQLVRRKEKAKIENKM